MRGQHRGSLLSWVVAGWRRLAAAPTPPRAATPLRARACTSTHIRTHMMSAHGVGAHDREGRLPPPRHPACTGTRKAKPMPHGADAPPLCCCEKRLPMQQQEGHILYTAVKCSLVQAVCRPRAAEITKKTTGSKRPHTTDFRIFSAFPTQQEPWEMLLSPGKQPADGRLHLGPTDLGLDAVRIEFCCKPAICALVTQRLRT